MTLLAAAVPIIGSVANAITPNPDADRFAKTLGWYNDALAGDASDACRLKFYSGRFGSGDCGTGVISGWATQAAKDYSYKLYNQYLAIKAGQISPNTPAPSPSSIPTVANTAATISEVAAGISQVAGQVAYTTSGGQTQTTAYRVSTALEAGKLLLIVGGIAVLAYLVFRSRR